MFGARLQAFVCLFSMSGYYIYLAREKHIGKQDNIIGVFEKKKKFLQKLKLCLVTVFVFYFQKLILGNLKKKKFLYFLNQKHV